MSELGESSENDKVDCTISPGNSVRSHGRGRLKKYEDPDLVKIPQHLVEGYRILLGIMKVSKYFHEYPNPKDKGLYDYYEVIKQPMCFNEIKQKFVDKEYTQFPEFVYDVRLLLVNCYRFFGPNTIQTKRALRVEELFEQKLALLSEEQRELCSIQATHGKLENVNENTAAVRDENSQFESKLLKSVEKEKASRILERKQKLAAEHCAEKEGKEKEILLWEAETLFTQQEYEMMRHMWEIPVIGHFVSLAIYQLNIESIPMYEIERMFLMPQASKAVARLMTTLLSSPVTRMKIHTKSSMPYKIWARKLALKVSGWYKLYNKSNNDPQLVFEKLGIEHQFWKIFGDCNPLEEYEFHELTFHQRVFLVKTLCDFIFQHHKLVRDTIAEMTDEFGTTLGKDRTGAKYIYFPQFLEFDVRVYKQNLNPKSWVDRDKDHQAAILNIESGNKLVDNGNIEQREEVICQCGSICECEKLNITTNNLKTLKNNEINDEDHEKLECDDVLKNCAELETEVQMESIAEKEQKEKKSLYRATWLEPNPEDFNLVADSVDGLRELLAKFCDDDDEDMELIQRLINSKKDKSNRPSCEVKLAHRLCTLVENLETLELKFVLERKKTLAKLYEEWHNFKDRPFDYIDPDEAFWLNEREPVEIHGYEVPETPKEIHLDVSAEREELPQTPEIDLPQTADMDSSDAWTGGMTLRHRRIENPPCTEFEQFCSSSEDEYDDLVLLKNRKRKRIKQIKCFSPNQSSEKKRNIQKNETQEDSGESTKHGDSDIEILDCIEKSPTKKLVTPLTEAFRQLEWEKKRQKLVNMADNKCIEKLKTTNITEMENRKSSKRNSSKMDQNIVQTDISNFSANCLSTVENSNETTLIEVLKSGSDSNSANVNSGEVQATRRVSQTKTLNVNTSGVLNSSSTSYQSPNSKPVNVVVNSVVPNAHVRSNLSPNITASRPPQNITQCEEVVILSDDSDDDDDIEFVDEVYNPKLDKNASAQKKPRTKCLLQDVKVSELLCKENNIVQVHSVL